MPHTSARVSLRGEGTSHGPNRDVLYEFHRAHDHFTKECQTLQMQIEKLIQEGHLSRYVQCRGREGLDKYPTDRGNKEEGQRSANWAIEHPAEEWRERSRSRQRAATWHHGTIATTSGGSASLPLKDSTRRREGCEVQTVLAGRNIMPGPVITFDDHDLRQSLPSRNKPMVISVVATEYKIERVLVDQGSFANILYWSTYQKLRLSLSKLNE
ncbi:hypothetical protein CR513_62369, partial [Mucuna pruriens]